MIISLNLPSLRRFTLAKKRNKISYVRLLLDPKRYIVVSLLSLGVAFYLIYTQVDFNTLVQTPLTFKLGLCLLGAVVCLAIRVLAYMWRLRILTYQQISWRNVFQVVFMWEFTSAITPSAVGGAPVAIYYLTKEGLSGGKSTAAVMLTALLDEVFFIVMLPICYFFMKGNLFPSAADFSILEGVKYVFFTSYFLIVLYAIVISYGLLVNPVLLKKVLMNLFKLPFLKRWQSSIDKVTNDIVVSSKEIKNKSFSFWTSAITATFTSWTARFILVNFLILGISQVPLDHFLIYARQLVMWVVMLISPTPGSSGVAEIAFDVYLHEFIPKGMSGILAIIWRILSYYFYIIMGFIVLPRWLKRVLIKRNLIRFKS